MILFIEHSRRCKLVQISGCLGRGFLCLFILIVPMVSGVYAYAEIYQVVRFKYVQFIVCQLYLNKGILKSKWDYMLKMIWVRLKKGWHNKWERKNSV